MHIDERTTLPFQLITGVSRVPGVSDFIKSTSGNVFFGRWGLDS